MAPRPSVRSAIWTNRWWDSYARLAADRQASCDRVAMALIKGTDTPGLNVKPILPDKHYLESRISSGDRIVFRVEGSTISKNGTSVSGRRIDRPTLLAGGDEIALGPVLMTFRVFRATGSTEPERTRK